MANSLMFFDSSFLYSFASRNDPHHTKSIQFLEHALSGTYGQLCVSNYIVDEVLTLSRVRTKTCQCGKEISILLSKEKEGKKLFSEIVIGRELVEKTNSIYWQYCSIGLSFTDCSTLAIRDMMEERGLQRKDFHLATYAREFQGLLHVVPE